MGTLSKARLQSFKECSHKYFDWNIVLAEGGVKDVQELDDQLLIKCPFHEDEVPSMRIRFKEQNYHCFACNRWGTVVDLMYELSPKSSSSVAYFEMLLKATPQMQRELGFNSLFLDAYSLDPSFESRRTFSRVDSIGTQMPLSILSTRVRKMGDTWENLVYSMTMLQHGETPDNIYAQLANLPDNKERNTQQVERVSLLSLLDD